VEGMVDKLQLIILPILHFFMDPKLLIYQNIHPGIFKIHKMLHKLHNCVTSDMHYVTRFMAYSQPT
jgi:hypothetical protein